MTTATQKIIDNIARYSKNPSSIQQGVLNVLEEVLTDYDIVDATSPFMTLLEASATAAAASIAAGESIVRKLYPILATSVDDLYHHMSDKDYIGRFATPAKTEVKMMLPLKELLDYAVYLNNNDLVRLVIIPRNTQIMVNGIYLGTNYPINIEILPHDVIQVKYDISEDSPLEVLTTNILMHRIITYQNVTYLEVTIPVYQFKVISSSYPLDGTSDFKQVIMFTDLFYYARVYIDRGNQVWTEILTTHTPIVYDINKPTAVLKVVDNSLTVSLPDIYNSLNLLGVTIRIDIYSTRGSMDIDLSEIPYANFSAKWIDLNTFNTNVGVAPLNKINDMIFYANTRLVNGTMSRTLEQTREQVIYHTKSTIAPIRPGDINIGLKALGYVVQRYTDSVTDRVYIANKNLPYRERDGLFTSVLATNANIIIDVNGGIPTGSYQQSIVTNARNRATVKPEALYISTDTMVNMLTDVELNAITNLSSVDLCALINSNNYMYSPFHYVIDYTQVTLKARPYHLTDPKIIGRTFENANAIRNYNITTTSYGITLVGSTYFVTLVASIPQGITNVSCQLRYLDKSSGSAIYFNATGVMGLNAGTFTIGIPTSLDIDQLDNIEILDGFNILGNSATAFMALESVFDIFYLVAGNNVGSETIFDDLYVVIGNMPAVIGATHETITLQFGVPLVGLYTPTKDILKSSTYLKYTQDIYAVYNETIYAMGPFGKEYTVDGDGKVVFTIVHNAGDTVMDDNGDPIILHHVGDIIYDVNGLPVKDPLSDNQLLRQVGLTLINGKYKFATHTDSSIYRDNIPYIVKGYLTDEIAPAAGKLHERTELYYKPMGVLYNLHVSLGGGEDAYVSSLLSFKITYYMSDENIDNISITNKINLTTRTIISEHISQSILSIAAVTKDLLDANGEYIVGFNIDKFLDGNISYMSIMDPGSTFSIAEELVVLPDGKLDVRDTVQVVFKTMS